MKAKDMPPQPEDDKPVNDERPEITWGHLFGRKEMKTTKTRREGFWFSESEPDLPRPKARAKPWYGQDHFLKTLCRLEYRLVPKLFKGSSECRVCGRKNGSGEYDHGGWVWPTGLYHMIKAHNVKPSAEFVYFVKEEAGK